MLFDLQGKRKRVIQVVYAFLALILAVGLVGLGIGGDAQGGIFDALGIGSGSSTTDAQYEEQIEDANRTLEVNPDNSDALLALARASYLAGNQQITEDDQGNQAISEEGLAMFDDSIAAWERYLDSLGKKQKPDASVANLVLQAYGNVAFQETDPVLIKRMLEGALETAEIAAANQPSPNAWLQVATYAYFSGDSKKGEQAGKRALAEANQMDQKAVKSQLKQLEKQGASIQKQLKQVEKQGQGQAAEALEDPLGQLGGGTGSTPAPAP